MFTVLVTVSHDHIKSLSLINLIQATNVLGIIDEKDRIVLMKRLPNQPDVIALNRPTCGKKAPNITKSKGAITAPLRLNFT